MPSCARGWAGGAWPRLNVTPGARWPARSSRFISRPGAGRLRQRSREVFTSRFQAWVRRNAQRLAASFARLPVTPNLVTVTGMLVVFASAVLVGMGQLVAGALVLAFGGCFDILDGALARVQKRSYPYGAFLDSTTDRYAEGAIYLGIAAHFLQVGGPNLRWNLLGAMLALVGSFQVSYI